MKVPMGRTEEYWEMKTELTRLRALEQSLLNPSEEMVERVRLAITAASRPMYAGTNAAIAAWAEITAILEART
jgi:hypothetical protein